MEFSHQGKCIRLHGLNQVQYDMIRPASMRKANTGAAQFYQLTVEPLNSDPNPKMGNNAPVVFLDGMKSLLGKFAEVFRRPIGLPPIRAQDHQIHLVPGATPVNVRPYRYPHFQKSEIEKLVDEMLSDGIIRSSTSPFSSPVLLVKKKDGTWRFCVDYRALTSITVKDRFPIPTVEELLDEIAGARVFSKLDLRAGYHQVRIHPNDIKKTAFRTHDGHYEFLVMPFGLSNALSTFQSMMNSTFRQVLRKFVLVFYDDILIYSEDWESHLLHLHEVFTRLRDHQLFAKLTKCEFGCDSLGYLGHIISGEGVAVDPDKIQAIRDWPLPSSVKALRRFLGLCGYYRRFVPRYSTLAAPLTELLRKDAFLWTPTATQAFQKLQEALMQTPVLQLPNFNLPFVVQTDASGVGIGAILLQNGHPISYFSKQLSARQQAASTYVREMLVITEAVKKWRQYLLGRRFTVQTDHRSLRALLHQTIQTPEQQRWLYKVVGYDFDIEYKPGVTNGPADALSRINRVSCHALFTDSRPQPILWEAIRKSYTSHPDTVKLIAAVTNDPGQNTEFSIRDGILLFKGKVWIPENSALQPLLLAEFHTTPTGGHAGVQRTLSRIASVFYWPELRRAVHEYVFKCTICQTTKPFNRAPQGLLQPLPIPEKIW